ncbi:metallophosphoesterase family protein [Mangrovimicrobium sediminis]|nr:metallophosphoesterase family protein [Haliea sp. SAOS-164]
MESGSAARALEIIEVGGAGRYSLEDIDALLARGKMPMSHGGEFTGRVSTTLFTDQHNILKVKAFRGNSEKGTRTWVSSRVQTERDFGLYHPDKTWCLVELDGEVFPANIMPYLDPLHQLLETGAQLSGQRSHSLPEHDQKVWALCQVIDMTLKKAGEKVCLDAGLSNFGYCPDRQTIYYIDDDTYQWDRFTSFSHVLLVYLRQLPWVTPDDIDVINDQIRQSVLAYFDNDPLGLYVIHERMKSLFIAEEKQPLLDRLLLNLRPPPKSRAVRKAVPVYNPEKKLAVFGDIHANAPALEAVLADIRRQGIEQAIVVGDVVGYGPHPAECVELMRRNDFMVVRGNHDHAASCASTGGRFSKSATWAIEWTVNTIGDADKAWLADIDTHLQCEQFIAMHGAPRDPTFFNAYVYASTYEKNLDYMVSKDLALCFHGHTHMPGVYLRPNKGMDRFEDGDVVDISSAQACLVSPGSVGQPRNQDWRAQYAVFDCADQTVTYHRVSYDLQSVVRDMHDREFPAYVMHHLARFDPDPGMISR